MIEPHENLPTKSTDEETRFAALAQAAPEEDRPRVLEVLRLIAKAMQTRLLCVGCVEFWPLFAIV